MEARDKQRLLALLKEKERREKYDKFHTCYFQDYYVNERGIDVSRHLYPKHLEFFNATNEAREIALIGPNRIGKTDAGSYAVTVWATKDYPEWWTGKRFPDHQQLEILIVGKTNEQVRTTTQPKLLGSLFDVGSGMIPKDSIHESPTRKPGVPGSVQDVYVKDKFGIVNHIQFMSGDVSDQVIMGRELHVVWFDEDCLNPDFYDEALMRTMTTQGIVFNTFTPLEGLHPVLLKFMPNGKFPEDGIVRDAEGNDAGKRTIRCGWSHIPHLPQEWKDDMKKRYTGAQLLSRTEGLPSIGSGHIYPIPEKDIVVEPFPIPQHWPRAYGMDFGWHETAAVWVAKDPNTNVLYVYAEYHKGHVIPFIHAEAIKQRGSWITGASDPAAGHTRDDGTTLFNEYSGLGLILYPAMNGIDTGIARLQMGFESGRIKIMSHCTHLLDEYRVYRYGEDGKPQKDQDDHELDALRYVEGMFDMVAMSELHQLAKEHADSRTNLTADTRNSWTGY